MSRILITGTTGYLGYILYQWFSEKSNYSILTLNERLENLIPQSLEVDWVIHCAAALRARKGEHHTSNVKGTQKLIEAFKNKPKIIYTSSKSVYGLIRNQIMTEKHTPIPDDDYGKSKLAGEKIITSSGLDYIILRLSGIYGELYGRSGNCFPDQALRNYRAGKKVVLTPEKVDHEYLHVGLICKAIEQFISSKVGLNEIYNFSGVRGNLQELIISITEGNVVYRTFPTKTSLFMDSSKIRNCLKIY